MSFIAKYRGTCEECGNDIEVGTEAAYVGDGIVHVPVCPGEPKRRMPLCPHCFLELPNNGTCECRE